MKNILGLAALVIIGALVVWGGYATKEIITNPLKARGVSYKIYSLLPDELQSSTKLRNIMTVIASQPWPRPYFQEDFSELLNQPQPPDEYRVTILGDSVPSAFYLPLESRWTSIVAKKLNKRLPEQKIKIINLAQPGETTTQAVKRIDQGILKFPSDLLLISYGLNDGYSFYFAPDGSSDQFVPIDLFGENMLELITVGGEQTGAKVMLMTASPIGPDFAKGMLTGRQLPLQDAVFRSYNALIRQTAQDINLPLIDVEQRFDQAGLITGLLQQDHLHPNRQAQILIAKAVIEAWDRTVAQKVDITRSDPDEFTPDKIR